MFVNTFWSLVPPIVAIGLALLTKETYSSLFIGIVVGALLATDFSPIGALDTIINDGLTAAIADNARHLPLPRDPRRDGRARQRHRRLRRVRPLGCAACSHPRRCDNRNLLPR